MERKTAIQYYYLHQYADDSQLDFNDIISLMRSYASQERQIAVEETLMVASEEAKCREEYVNVIDKQSILSLAPQIILKLNNK